MARSEATLNAVFTDTAKAIQDKKGDRSTKISPLDFADEIASISTTKIEEAPSIYLNLDFATAGCTFDDWYTDVTYSQGNPGTRPEVSGTVDLGNEDSYETFDLKYARVRGNWSVNYRKKSLKLKFEKKVNLLKLNNNVKAKEWLLLSNYNDNSGLRNALGFYMGQRLFKNTDQWSPTFTWVHVYVTWEIQKGRTTRYLGLYLLCDQKEVGNGRININEPEEYTYEEGQEVGPDGYEGTDIGYFFEWIF